MAGLRSKATVTGSLPLEAALVKNADGSAIASPSYADCTYDSASNQWICDTPAPNGTYGPGAQLMRLKGSNPAVTAGSLGTQVVAGGGTITKLSTPTGTQASATGQTSLSVVADSDPNATSWKLFNSATSGGTFTQLGGTLSSPTYNHTGLSAGQTQYYQWQKIGNGSTYSDSDRSDVFSGTTQSAAGNTVTFQSSDFSQNSMDGTPAEANAPYRLRSAFSRLDLKTTGTGIGLKITFRSGSPQQLKVMLNGTEVATQASDGTTNVRDTGMYQMSASDVLTVIEGNQYSVDDQNDNLGSYALQAYTSTGGTVSVVAPVKTAKQFYFVHDSIGEGWLNDRPINSAPVIRLRGLLGYDVISDGWGDRSFSRSLGTAAKRTTQVSRLSASLNGRTEENIWIALGRNDARHPYGTVADVKTVLTDLLNKVVAARPNARIFVQTPGVANEDASINMASYRTGIVEVVTALNNPKVFPIDGPKMYGTGDLNTADYLHITDAAGLVYAQNIVAAMANPANYAPATTPAEGTFTPPTQSVAFNNNSAQPQYFGMLLPPSGVISLLVAQRNNKGFDGNGFFFEANVGYMLSSGANNFDPPATIWDMGRSSNGFYKDADAANIPTGTWRRLGIEGLKYRVSSNPILFLCFNDATRNFTETDLGGTMYVIDGQLTQALRDNPNLIPTANIWGKFDMKLPTSGNVISDTSGNGHNLTLYGF